MDWYEPEVRALEDSLRQTEFHEPPAAFYGSSSIRLWTGLAHDLDSPRALNIGFGGSTLAACVHFFDRLVPPVHPASLTVYAGDNDLGDGAAPQQVLESFRALAALVHNSLPHIPFGFISIKLSPARNPLRDRIVETNSLIRQDIEQHPNAYYIDIFTPMLDSQSQPRPELFVEDGLHLNPDGYQLWAKLLQPYRNQIFTPLLPGIANAALPSHLA